MPAQPRPDATADASADATTAGLVDYWCEHDMGSPRGYLVMSSFLRFHQLLRAAVEPRLKRHGLGLTDYLLLVTLAVRGKPTIIGELGREMLVRSTTVTFAIERLERHDLVIRAMNPTDRRAVDVAMTPAGHDLVRRATRELVEVEFGVPGSDGPVFEEIIPLLGALRDAAGDTPR
jgi:DNA-binding MarR family transcriptional regulator